MFTRKKAKGSLNAEVNLVPFIDLLSVCISFLLFTAVWLQAGVLSSKQGLGTEAESKEENPQSFWVELESKDSVLISTQGLVKNEKKKRLSSNQLEEFAQLIKKENPKLHTALVFPQPDSSYEDLTQTMNSLRKVLFTDVGIAPL